MKKTEIRIKFFMDFICEWCFLGYGILKQLQKEYDFDLELYPLEIHPDTREDGIPMVWHIHNKKHWVNQLNKLGEPYGIYLLDKDIFANTHNALLVGQYAKTIGKLEEYTEALWERYMHDGVNISSREAVEEVAKSIGIGEENLAKAFEDPIYAAALERNQAYQQMHGTDQVPTFVVNDSYIMIGAQSADTWRDLFALLAKEQQE